MVALTTHPIDANALDSLSDKMARAADHLRTEEQKPLGTAQIGALVTEARKQILLTMQGQPIEPAHMADLSRAAAEGVGRRNASRGSPGIDQSAFSALFHATLGAEAMNANLAAEHSHLATEERHEEGGPRTPLTLDQFGGWR